MRAKRTVPSVKRTVLIVVEGENDHSFLAYLKRLYLNPDKTRLSLSNAYGGSATNLVMKCIRIALDKEFSEKFVLMDADFALHNPTDFNKAKNMAQKREHQIKIIESAPCCLECLLLELLDKKPKYIKDCQDCKSLLKKTLNRDDETCLTVQDFERYFPKKLLDSKRESINTLNRLIHLIEV